MAKDCQISGYAFLLHGGAVSWTAKWQKIISLSTTDLESEYIAATYAAKEALWLHSLLSQLFDITPDTTTLFSDNQLAIALTKDHQYHTKHIDVQFHFIWWIVKNGSIRLIYCPTDNIIADVLTKALPSPKVKHFVVELGLISI